MGCIDEIASVGRGSDLPNGEMSPGCSASARAAAMQQSPSELRSIALRETGMKSGKSILGCGHGGIRRGVKSPLAECDPSRDVRGFAFYQTFYQLPQTPPQNRLKQAQSR